MTKENKDEKLKAGLSQSGLKELLCVLSLYEDFAKDRRKEQDRIENTNPLEARVEGLTAQIFEQHVNDLRFVIEKHT